MGMQGGWGLYVLVNEGVKGVVVINPGEDHSRLAVYEAEVARSG